MPSSIGPVTWQLAGLPALFPEAKAQYGSGGAQLPTLTNATLDAETPAWATGYAGGRALETPDHSWKTHPRVPAQEPGGQPPRA